MPTDSAACLTELDQLQHQSFNLEEIRTVCFQLNVGYESPAGGERQARIRKLLLWLARRGRLQDLLNSVKKERSHIDWLPIPKEFQLPKPLANDGMNVPLADYHVYGDRVGGDKITANNISGSSGRAIGRESSASVHVEQRVCANNLDRLFTPSLFEVVGHDPKTIDDVQTLKEEVEKGEAADDESMADLIVEISEAAPYGSKTLTD